MQDALGVVLSSAQGYSPAFVQTATDLRSLNRESAALEDNLNENLHDNHVSPSRHQSASISLPTSIHTKMSGLMEPSETDKRAIYKHPLFPLMALLFERCEQVTQSPDCPLVANLKSDIQAFVQHHQQHLANLESCIGKQPEVDSLMIKAIQILWIHLLELEKVNDLCKDFCTRYISCLRTKLQNEQLLHVDAFESDCSGSLMVDLPSRMSQSSESSMYRSMSYEDRPNLGPRDLDQREGSGGGGHGNHIPDNSMYRMDEKPDDQQMMEQQRMQSMQMETLGRPSVGVRDGSILMPQHSGSMVSAQSRSVSPTLLASFASFDDGEDDPRARMKKGILPKQATHVMKTWLFQHLVHPYPTEDEKRQLAEQTNLSILQVNNWFINARRRILQPIVDAGNQEGGSKVKKAKGRSGQSQLSPDISLGAGSVPGQRLPSCSESRSESSTPTSTTFEYDQNSLSEYQSRPQKDISHDESEEPSVPGHLKTSAGFFGYSSGSYFPSVSQNDPHFLPEGRPACPDSLRSVANLDCDSYMGPNYSSDRDSTSDGEGDEN